MDAATAREEIYDLFARRDLDRDERIRAALDVGVTYLGLSVGYFTRVDDGVQTITHAVGDHPSIRAGESCALEETYCQRTVDRTAPLAVQRVDGETIPDAAIERFGLGTYIGAPVSVDGEPYGTVCFAADYPRDDPFSERDELLVELLATQISRDVERERNREALRERTERLASIADTSFDIIFRIDRSGAFTYVSAAAERVLDYDPDDLVGTSFADHLRGDAAADALDAYERVLDGESVAGIEVTFADAHGDPVDIEVNATPVVEDGDVTAVQGVGRDVTERNARRRELRRKTRAMDEADVGLSVADVTADDEPLVYVNEGFADITGYDAAEATGRNCRFLQGDVTDPDAVAELRAAVDARDSATVDLVNYRKNGDPYWNRVTLSPIHDETGTVTHYFGSQEDVTGQKRTQRLVDVLNRVLRHNLRNDLNVVEASLDLLVDADDEESERFRERIRDHTTDLLDLGESARELKRYAERERDVERLAPESLCAAAIDTVRERHPDASVSLDVRTDRDLCAGRDVERALVELVENAVVHHPGPDPTVAVTVDDDGEWVVLTVRDDGSGIAPVEAAAVERERESAVVHGGGLGLWLVNWIVTRYGGSFAVEARDGDGDGDGDGGGTTATVRLPAVGDADSLADAARPPTLLSR